MSSPNFDGSVAVEKPNQYDSLQLKFLCLTNMLTVQPFYASSVLAFKESFYTTGLDSAECCI